MQVARVYADLYEYVKRLYSSCVNRNYQRVSETPWE